MADDIDEFPDDDFLDSPTEEDKNKYNELAAKLEKRCEESEIKFEKKSIGEFGCSYDIYFPSGRDEKSVSIFDIEDLENILSFEFEEYRFVEKYNAVYSIKRQRISARTRPLANLPAMRFEWRRHSLMALLLPPEAEKESAEKVIDLRQEDESGSGRIVLRFPSRQHKVMTGYGSQLRSLELIMLNLKFENHDEAVKLLERLSDSLFLQIEAESGVSLELERTRRTVRGIGKINKVENKNPKYQFPRVEYDHDPMTFYRYAINAVQMPLMQYLAFYQTIEYYFPVYSQSAAKRAVRNVLKEPNFRVDREADVSKVLTAAKMVGSRGFGSEKSQLFETLKECVSEKEIKEYLMIDSDRKEFFSRDKNLKVHRIPLDAPSIDVYKELAERIYEIRCRIVHTKLSDEGKDVSPLLPYTKEERYLRNDIELIKLIACKVICSSGSQLSV